MRRMIGAWWKGRGRGEGRGRVFSGREEAVKRMSERVRVWFGMRVEEEEVERSERSLEWKWKSGGCKEGEGERKGREEGRGRVVSGTGEEVKRWRGSERFGI